MGLALTGNMLGLNEQEMKALPQTELESRLAVAREELAAVGAHYVIDGVHGMADVIRAINRRLAAGEKP